MEYKVLRPHQGDKWYAQGDPREAKEADVAHLVKAGVLKPADQDDPAGDEGQKAVPENAGAGAGQQLAPEKKAVTPSETATQKPDATGVDPVKQGKSKD